MLMDDKFGCNIEYIIAAYFISVQKAGAMKCYYKLAGIMLKSIVRKSCNSSWDYYGHHNFNLIFTFKLSLLAYEVHALTPNEENCHNFGAFAFPGSQC